jgi:hypothetical protein
MNGKALPSDEQMLLLKRELNHLVWTDDAIEAPESFAVVAHVAKRERTTANIQCVAHACLTAGLFVRRGFHVTTRGGKAFVVELSKDGDRTNDRLEEIGRHWWMTLDDYGLVDLSLHGELEGPLIYCKRTPSQRWRVAYGDHIRKLQVFLEARQKGAFYLTQNKRPVTEADLLQSLAQEFPPAKRQGIQLPYAAILEHCEQVLSGAKESLRPVAQATAWEQLAP